MAQQVKGPSFVTAGAQVQSLAQELPHAPSALQEKKKVFYNKTLFITFPILVRLGF